MAFLKKKAAPDLESDYRYRDVYSNQKRERSKIEGVTPYWPWQVGAGLLAVLFMTIAWMVLSFVLMAQSLAGGMGFSVGNPIVATGDPVATSSVVQDAQQGQLADGTTGGGDTTGASILEDKTAAYADAYGSTYEAFRDRYFTFSRKSGGMLSDRYTSNVDGVEYLESNIQAMWIHLTDGYPSPEFDAMFEHTAEEPLATPDVPKAGLTVPDIGWCIRKITLWKVLLTLLTGLVAYSILDRVFRKKWEAQNQLNDTTDINQYDNDQHIQTPDEVQKAYDWFPDVGAHAPVQVSSLISHMALSNKGLKPVMLTKRADKDMTDKDGAITYFKGEALEDEDGEIIQSKVPAIDEAFMDSLWDASGLPKDKRLRKRFDPSAIAYNPENKSRERLKDADTVADMINKYWTLPEYEPQRPAGAYIVDTDPVNTMVLAIVANGVINA